MIAFDIFLLRGLAKEISKLPFLPTRCLVLLRGLWGCCTISFRTFLCSKRNPYWLVLPYMYYEIVEIQDRELEIKGKYAVDTISCRCCLEVWIRRYITDERNVQPIEQVHNSMLPATLNMKINGTNVNQTHIIILLRYHPYCCHLFLQANLITRQQKVVKCHLT